MHSGSNRYRSSLVREDAYFSEIDQILLSNLRDTLELQAEASACLAGGCNDPDKAYQEQCLSHAAQFSLTR